MLKVCKEKSLTFIQPPKKENQEKMRADLSLKPLFVQFVKTILGKEPEKKTVGAAAYDLFATTVTLDQDKDCVIVDVGIRTSFPQDAVMLIFARSGLAMNHGIHLANGVAVIDSDYRGPIKVILRSSIMTTRALFDFIKVGDRVAQAMFIPVYAVEFIRVQPIELEQSERGEGGFGSTGTR